MARRPQQVNTRTGSAVFVPGQTALGIPKRAGGKAVALPVVEQPYVLLVSEDADDTIKALLGPDGATVSGGYSRYDRVSRPRKRDLTPYAGIDPYVMDLDLVLDGWNAQATVEPIIRRIERLATPVDDGQLPPVIYLSGPVPKANQAWRIEGTIEEDFEWTIYRAGERIRARLGLTLVQAVDDETLAEQTAKKKRQGKAGTKTTRVRDGEDRLSDVARRVKSSAKELADLNDLRLAAKLKKGQVLKTR